MIRILALPRFSFKGAGSRYRIHNYIPYLRKLGFTIDVSCFFEDNYLERLYRREWISPLLPAQAYLKRISTLLRSRSYDLVWINWEALPWMPYALESFLLSIGQRFVVDYDDALFHQYDSHKSSIVRWMLADKVRYCMRDSAMVIAGNKYLANYAENAGASKVRILPTVVDLNKYECAAPREPATLNIGWIGTPVTAKLLYSIEPALQQVCRDGSARLTLVGSGPIKLRGVPTTVRSWSETTEVQEIQQFDVGIMPLDENDRFCKGKCGLKLIQYMACGIPVVGTPLGVNTDLIQNDVTGYQASGVEEWTAALNAMKTAVSNRQRMGINGRRLVEQKYSSQAAEPRLAELLLEATGKGLCLPEKKAA